MIKLLPAVFLYTFLISSAFATNGYFSHGTGVKNKSMAGAGVAFPMDAMAGATNPAGMSFIGNQFTVGATLFMPDRKYKASSSLANGNGGAFTIGPDSETSDDKWFIIPSFGINKDINETTSIGFSIYGNGGLNTSYDGGSATFDPTGMGAPPVTFPGTFGAGTASVDLFQIFFNLSLAYKINENFSVGVSPIFAVQAFRANGLDNFAPFTKTFNDSFGATMPDSLTSNGSEYSYGGGVQVGTLYRNIGGMLDLGASYRSKIYMTEFDDYSDLFAEDGDFDVPPTLWLGFAVRPNDSLAFVFDFQRIWYGDVDAVSNDVQNLYNCPVFTNFTGGNSKNCLGGSNGGGFGWRDIDVLKFGVQWQASKQNIFRAGYSHADQTIPSDQVTFNILAPGVIEDHVTAGYTRVLNDTTEINFEAMYALKESVKGRNAFDPTQTIELEMQQYEFGVSWSKSF